MSQKVALEIIALSHSVTQSHSFAVVLGEVGGSRRIPIVIGGAEAQAIAVALDNIKPSRPLTHDLMKSLCDTFSIELKYIHICKLEEGVFYSNIVCIHQGEEFEIDSRTSDAIALAVRFNCPIFIEEQILQEVGSEQGEGSSLAEEEDVDDVEQLFKEESTSGEELASLSKSELEIALRKAIEAEDYELAARLRDELGKRS
jgi:bifunctional DNase/RNase